MNAVNSEYQNNILVDYWRMHLLFRHTSKEGNPMNKFGIGSLETLNQKTIRDDLIEFYKKYYRVNLMKVVIYE
jgi:insulysin